MHMTSFSEAKILLGFNFTIQSNHLVAPHVEGAKEGAWKEGNGTFSEGCCWHRVGSAVVMVSTWFRSPAQAGSSNEAPSLSFLYTCPWQLLSPASFSTHGLL